MESRNRAAQTVNQREARTVWRLRLIATSVGLTALTFISQPGRIVGDTKADLVLDPGAFLGRALHLWDPNGSFGQIQNQAYGYLFPMGPFFWLARLVDVPEWATQRLWWSLLLVVAFLGFVKLCGVLQIGSPVARIIGGVAFALSPRMLTVIGPSSIEVWPSALGPWVLVPLAIGLKRGNPRYLAALSAVAVACVGGVNAAATFAVIPLGVILLLMADPGPRRRSLMLWWPGFVLLGTLWWLIPLALLGRYSPPFLDFIESASVTTFAATIFDGLRGTTNWVPYVDGSVQAGYAVISNPTFAINSAVIVTLGLWGISRRDNPHARFLAVSVLVGLTLVTLGHVGAFDGIASTRWQALLDGALSPLRNTHKFDVVVRIPLLLGLVHLMTVLASPRAVKAEPRSRTSSLGVLVLVGAAILGSTIPAWTGDLARRGSFTSVPQYWTDTADWLNDNAKDQNSLLLPGSSFADYLWGSPRDEALQAFTRTPWSVRNAIPLAPPGSIRTLDAIEADFAQGEGSLALQTMLQRSGIRYLIVRNDLAGFAGTDSETIYSTLAGMPDVRSVAGFGPLFGNPPTKTSKGKTVFINQGLQSRHRIVEVFEVPGVDSSKARAQDLATTPVVVGTPGALLLQDGLVLAATNVLLSSDVPDGRVPSRVVLTDTNRKREAAFGRVVDNRSASMTPDEAYVADRPIHDYDTSDSTRWKAVRTLIGAKSIRASTSLSTADSLAVIPSQQPWSAFDGDLSTRWTSQEVDRSWIELKLDRPMSVQGLTVELAPGQPTRRVTVTTDAGSTSETLRARSGQTFSIPPGLTRTVRISSPATSNRPLSISEVAIPGVPLSRPLTLPELPSAWGSPSDIILAVEPGQQACRTVVDVRRCLGDRDGLGEDGRVLDRIITLNEARDYAMGLTVIPQSSQSAATAFSDGVKVAATSLATRSSSTGVLAAMDDNPKTGWIASLRDAEPVLHIALDGVHELSELRLRTDESLAASSPRKAELTFSNGTKRSVEFDTGGLATFSPVTATSVSVRITNAYVTSNLELDGSGTGLPLGVSEIELPGSGVDVAGGAQEVRKLRCGSGPDVAVGSRTYETSVSGSRADVVAGRELATSICSKDVVSLTSGSNRITVRSNAAFRPALVRFYTSALTGPAESSPLPTSHDSTVKLDIGLVPADQEELVSLAQNVNPGWTVGSGRPITVNGWMQGWIVSKDSSLDATFGADRTYRLGLLGGAMAVMVLLGSAWLLSRRQLVLGPDRRPRRLVRGWCVTVGVVGLLAMLGGLVGLAITAVVAALVLSLRRMWAEVVVPSMVMASAAAYFVEPWNFGAEWAGSAAWPQWLALASVAGVAVLAFDDPIRRSFNRMIGRSTTR